MHIRNSNVDYEWVSMCHWTVGFIKTNNFNTRTPIWTVACKKPPCIITFTFLNARRKERTEDFPPFREVFDWDGIRKKAEIFVLVLLHKYIFSPQFSLRTLWTLTTIIWCGGFLWDINLNIRNQRSENDQIWSKYIQYLLYGSS